MLLDPKHILGPDPVDWEAIGRALGFAAAIEVVQTLRPAHLDELQEAINTRRKQLEAGECSR